MQALMTDINTLSFAKVVLPSMENASVELVAIMIAGYSGRAATSRGQNDSITAADFLHLGFCMRLHLDSTVDLCAVIAL